MKKHPRLSLLLSLVILAALGAVQAAENPPADPAPLIAAALKPIADAKPSDPAVWAAAEKIKALGKEALPQIRAADAGSTVPQRLALGWALLSLQDFGPGVKILAAVAADKTDRAARIAAADALGDLARDAAEVDLTRLLNAADDDVVRVAFARALARAAATDAAEAKATAALVRLARSTDPETLGAAALALAELDDFRDPVPATLKALALEPTPRGRLAAKLLEIKRLSDLMIREKEYTGSLGNPLLDEIKRKIIEYHIDPPPKEEVLVDAAARGMVASLHRSDPFSSYMSAKDWDDFREQMAGVYAGVGAQVLFLKDERTGEKVFTTVKPIYSGPAYRAGLRSYDQFLEIDGQAIAGKTAEQLRDMLRGLPESVVACKVRRRALPKDEEILLRIIRSQVSMPSVHHDLLPGGIGYLRLDSFGDTSAPEVEAALVDLEKKGMKALVFDLRDDPGGLLLAARDIADKFLKGDKLIVYSEGRNKEIASRKELRTSNTTPHPDFPLFVLVNENSASASEIVAGALQDHKRGTLVGERTYGKGSVQQLMNLDATGRHAVLRLTIAKYFLPSGRCIHRTPTDRGGILPDVEVAFEPTWSVEQFEKHRAASDFFAYSLTHWPADKKKLMELAGFDGRDAANYPGFDPWFNALKVKTDRETARMMLRQWLRVLAADELGRDWPADLEEDNQLQRAVFEAGRVVPGLDLKAVPEYKWFAVELDKKLKAAPAPVKAEAP